MRIALLLLLSLFAAPLLANPALATPALAASPWPGTDAELELTAVVSTTRLDLVNPTADPVLVRLHDRDGHALTELVVPGRGVMTFDFPRHTLDGTSLRVIAATAEGGVRGTAGSGLLHVDDLLSGGYRTIWFESKQGTVHAFGELPSGPELIAPEPGSSTLMAVPPPPPSPHVPVIQPGKRHRGDLPPKIEPDPLPPV